MAQVAATLIEQDKLAASHFFSRIDFGTAFVPTICYQLARNITAFRAPLAAAIEKDPAVFSKSVRAQFEALIAKPLVQLSDKGSLLGKIIMIDAVDECGNSEAQLEILSIIVSACQSPDFPLSFLVSGRPEYALMSFFNREAANSITLHYNLHTDAREVDRDIEMYLRSRFEDIRQNHPAISSSLTNWPSDSVIELLVRKASGQFIYASSVMKFIENARQNPVDQLDRILGLKSQGNEAPLASLDALYSHLLLSVHDWESVAPVFRFLLRNFQAPKPSTLSDAATSLNLELEEMQAILSDLHSIMYVPPANQPDEEIRLYHASFADFLRDQSRAGPFYIDMED